MRLKFLLLLFLLCTCSFSLGQKVVTLEFESEADVVAFVSAKVPTEVPADTVEGQGQSVEVPLDGSGDLYVLDRRSGNMASRPVTGIGDTWSLKPGDFTFVGTVTIRVLYDRQPVQAARVVLKDGNREQSQLIDATSNGEAKFVAVEPGEVRATVEYKSGGSQAEPVTQVFTVELDRTHSEPLFTVSVPEETAVIGSGGGSAPAQESAEEEKKTSRPNPIGSVIVYLLALAAAVAAGYYGLMYIRNNPKQVADQLQKFGVPVQEPSVPPGASADPDPVPMAPPKPQPQQKIILEDAAPAPISATGMVPPTPVSLASEPRLVKDTGEFVMLDEGEIIVGREDGLGLSLIGESTVSRRHASVVRQGGTVKVRDLGSTNGTFVNGRRIADETHVKPGDDVQFGAVRFRLEG